MKKILRVLIVIGIIVGIFFGVRAIINSKRSETYLYDKLEWYNKESSDANDDSLENSLKDFKNYIENKKDSIPKTITNSVKNDGDCNKAIELYGDVQELFLEYKKKVVLIKTTDKDIQDDIVKTFDDFVSAIKKRKEAVENLTKYIKKDSVSEKDLVYYFNQVLNEIKNSTQSLTLVVNKIDNYLLQEVYGGKYTKYDDLKNSLKIKMIKAYCENNGLENDKDMLSDRLNKIGDQERLQLIIDCSKISNIYDLLKAENKSSYIWDKNDYYKDVARLLFKVVAKEAE